MAATEIYTQSPRALGVYFRQIPSSYGITDIFHLGDLTPSEKLLPCFGNLFILDFENFNCGKNVRATTIVVNISVMFECGLYTCHFMNKKCEVVSKLLIKN